LSLSFKVNHVVDLYQQVSYKNVRIVTPEAKAEEEKSVKETAELTDVLQNGTKQEVTTERNTNAFTNSELKILQELAERREALDIKAKEIDKRAIQLRVAENEIDKKIKQLKEYEQKLNELINKYSQKEQENVEALVKLYASMKPKDAARIFNTMDVDISVAILRGMKPSSSSAILSQMDAQKAQTITAELIGNNI
jgi:flagellar motility protein MotE (MotC chaperone)